MYGTQLKLTDIPEELLNALDYSKLHHGEYSVRSIKKLLSPKQYRVYMHGSIGSGEYRFDYDTAGEVIIDIY